MAWYNKIPFWGYLIIGAIIMGIAALLEYHAGRVPMCKCGYVQLWVTAVNSPENSQQISDWYSFSHIIHGMIFYGLFRWIGRRVSKKGKWPLGLCLVLAILVEASWEVLENSSFIINRYRSETMSLDYFGDSILNSMSDILFCIIGFFLAYYLPVWLIIFLIIAMELGVGYAIHDNLTLNVIMLIYPFKSIKAWQMMGGPMSGG